MLLIRTILILGVCCATLASGQDNRPDASHDQIQPPQPPRPKMLRVSTEAMLGHVDHKTMPVYPDEAMSKGIQGDVIFAIMVDETGKITSSAPVGGDPQLVAAGKDALRTFHFHPYLLNGTPIKVQSQIGFHFSVEKTADGANGHVECMTSISAAKN